MTRSKKLLLFGKLFLIGGLLLSLLAPVYTVALQYSNTINKFLKCQTTKLIEGTSDEDTNYFPSDYDTEEEVAERAAEVAREVETEGLVLLKNDGALPVKSGTRISCFAQGSVSLNYNASGSSASSTDGFADLKTALESKGMEVNKTLWDWYSGNGYRRSNSTSGLVKTYPVNEAPWTEVTAACSSSFAGYGDMALVVLSRDSGEGFDASTQGSDGEDGSYLSITPEEEDMLEGLTELKKDGTFKNIVVVLNAAVPLELDFMFRDTIDVDACLWVGNVGMSGIYGVADVMAGVSPSGRLSDTFCRDNFSSPAMMSWMQNDNGIFAQSYVNPNGYSLNITQQYYGVYVEGIYSGYRYYETRYEDYVMGSKGVGEYSYSSDVAYPFGYGLSYTTFEYSGFDVKDASEDEYEVTVTVKNGGSVPAKEVVQVYLQKPYDPDVDLEVASAELVGFAKTQEIQPGRSETVTISVRKELFKSYDANTYKTYVQPAGDYLLTVAKDAHEAVNNFLAYKGYTPDNTEGRMTAAGDSSFVKCALHLGKMDTQKYSLSVETGKAITNLLDAYDINKYENRGQNSVTYVSRGDWQGTLPKASVKLTIDSQNMYNDLGSNKSIEDEGADEIVYSVDSGLTAAALRGFDYDNKVWDDLLNQMSFEEQALLVTNGAFGTSFIGSVNAEATKASDGPTGVIDSITSSVMPGEGVWASSFNTDLIEEVGDIIAEDARINDFDTMYAPGVNLHRTPFGGRANEYFSEDPYLTAMSAVAEIKGMQAKGVISVIKHFAFNEAESARNGISVWLNEQAARELYLMPFEYAMRPSIGATYGAMSSFNRAGTIWTGASRALQMDIARDEWDYQGYFITDMADGNGALYMVYTDGIYNGTDLFLGNGSKSALAKWRNNAAFRMRVREAAHRVLYVNTNFNSCMNGIASDTKIVEIIPWWQATLIALISVVAAGTAASLALWGVAFFKKKTKHAEHS